MKVQVSIELDDDQRIAVGLLETGKLVPASREEVRSYVTQVSMASINTATKITNIKRHELVEEIKATMLGDTVVT